MNKKTLGCIIIILLFLAGCATAARVYQSNPTVQSAGNANFEAKLEPLRAEGHDYFNSFRFGFSNKTNKDLIIVWSKSYYLHNGKKRGLFGWEGLTFEQLKGLKAEPDQTFPAGESSSIRIFPLQLLGWKGLGEKKKGSTPEEGFSLGVIPQGENGLSLAVKLDGKLIREKISVNITLN
jgi:hypothetical protein